MRELEARVTALELQNERLMGEAAAIEALREAIEALDLNSHKADAEAFKKMYERIEEVETTGKAMQVDLEAEMKRIEGLLGGSTRLELLKQELMEELMRLR